MPMRNCIKACDTSDECVQKSGANAHRVLISDTRSNHLLDLFLPFDPLCFPFPPPPLMDDDCVFDSIFWAVFKAAAPPIPGISAAPFLPFRFE